MVTKFKKFEIQILKSQEVATFLNDLASLRIQVFKDWPYLYEGSLDYEKNYLQTYVRAKNSFVAICYDGTTPVGATTAIDLRDEEAAFQKPFIENGYAIEDVVYFGESILLAPYRGHGIGQLFMDLRLQFTQDLKGKKMAAFCAVQRPSTHPLKPEDYRPLDGFWQKNGFEKVPGMVTSYKWKDINEQQDSEKPMQFWIKEI